MLLVLKEDSSVVLLMFSQNFIGQGPFLFISKSQDPTFDKRFFTKMGLGLKN